MLYEEALCIFFSLSCEFIDRYLLFLFLLISTLALRDSYVPATIGYQTPDPECDLDIVPNEGRKADIKYALSNSLGFGGHNAAVLFKKYED